MSEPNWKHIALSFIIRPPLFFFSCHFVLPCVAKKGPARAGCNHSSRKREKASARELLLIKHHTFIHRLKSLHCWVFYIWEMILHHRASATIPPLKLNSYIHNHPNNNCNYHPNGHNWHFYSNSVVLKWFCFKIQILDWLSSRATESFYLSKYRLQLDVQQIWLCEKNQPWHLWSFTDYWFLYNWTIKSYYASDPFIQRSLIAAVNNIS